MILGGWCYMFRGIYHHLIQAQEQIYSRFVQNVKLAKPTFSTRRGDTRTTAWACATCLLFENLLPVASYSRRVSDLKVPTVKRRSSKGQVLPLRLSAGVVCCPSPIFTPSLGRRKKWMKKEGVKSFSPQKLWKSKNNNNKTFDCLEYKGGSNVKL